MTTPAIAHFDELLAALAGVWRSLPDKPEESPEPTLRALWLAAAGAPRAVTRADGDLPSLEPAAVERLRALVARRVAGEPLAYLTGRQEFMGLEMLAAPGALIPRRETELLARTALELARAAADARGEATVLDLCTGSGNVALAVAAHEPRARVLASDLSEDAVRLARRNAEHLGLSDRAAFAPGDLFEAFERVPGEGAADVITCNPPYISSGRLPSMPDEIAAHEPRLAFDGGALGLSIVLRVLATSPRFLRPGGWLCLEVGLGQGEGLARRTRRAEDVDEVREVADADGRVRVLAVRRRL